MTDEIPNQRLLNKFANWLKGNRYQYSRQTLNVEPSKQKVVSWRIGENTLRCSSVMLVSNPVAGNSYFDAIRFGSDVYDQVRYSFIAQTPVQIYQRLLAFGIMPSKVKGGCDV